MPQLSGRAVIVTGAGRGLGREHALALARQGASVVVNDLLDPQSGADPAADVVAEIVAAGGRAVADHHSVASWDGAAAIVRSAIDEFGRLDGLVNNAGFLRDRTLVNMSETEWDDIITVHQYGAFYMLRHAGEYWRTLSKDGKQFDASVVMTTAISGLHSNPGQLNYGAAKAAIALMTLVAARELGRYGVRVNAISPLARTRLTTSTPNTAVTSAQTDGEFDPMNPAHAATLVSWLLSPQCRATSQVYAIFGREVHRYTAWTPAESAISPEDWTIDSIADAIADWPADFQPVAAPGLPQRPTTPSTLATAATAATG